MLPATYAEATYLRGIHIGAALSLPPSGAPGLFRGANIEAINALYLVREVILGEAAWSNSK